MKIISKRFGKVVEIGLTSLSVPMKGELIDLGLNKGDRVSISLVIVSGKKHIIIKHPEVK